MPISFRFYTKKSLLSCPYFVKKSPFSKKYTALMPLLWSKNVHFQKHGDLMSFFSKFSCKTHCCNADIWSKNVSSVKTILWAIKVNRISFLYDFSPKYTCSYAHILSKKRHRLKNTLVSCPYVVKNTSIISKTMCFHVILFFL